MVTGTIEGMTRQEVTQALEEAGASVTTSVSGRTSVLVAGADPGTKLARAQELGVPIVDEDAVGQLIETGVLPGA